jgi:PHD/YefM family antitoxin component YafN of YafNO toxin-antitoxin module
MIYRYIMTANKSRLVSIPKSDLDSLEATLETLENEYVMDQLGRSEQDIIKGKVRNVRDLINVLSEYYFPDASSFT